MGKSSEEKKKYILNIFDISDSDTNILRNKSNIVLTQQFSSDGFISEGDQINIYKQIIDKYDQSSIVLKIHQRDTINYKKCFPNVYVFDKPVPMQLLVLIGVTNFKKVITICSSAISQFPSTIEKEWIGSSVHPEIYKLFPNLTNNIYG